jgi:NADPH:quinone reductase-like Zn-dependent oxidoreductase
VVYGTGTTVGQYTCQVLRLAGYKTVIVTASPMHHEYLRSLGATHTFDYSSPTLADEVIKAACGKVTLIIDCIATEGTLGDISKFAAPDAVVAVLLDIKEGNSMYVTDLSKTFSELPKDRNPFPESVKIVGVSAFQYFDVSHYSEPR